MKQRAMMRFPTLSNLLPFIEQLSTADLLFLDVDDTLITPADPTFRWLEGQNPYVHFMDELKQSHGKAAASIVGHWRLQRKVQWVDPAWPGVMQECLQRGVRVYALTKMDVGVYGPIPEVEAWRLKELRDLGCVFTESFLGKQACLLTEVNSVEAPPCAKPVFKQGIFFTSGYTKAAVLQWILKQSVSPHQKVMVVDDKREQLEEMSAVCTELASIQWCHYEAARALPGSYEPEIFKKRIERLVATQLWEVS